MKICDESNPPCAFIESDGVGEGGINRRQSAQDHRYNLQAQDVSVYRLQSKTKDSMDP